jgi:hypothetical protein
MRDRSEAIGASFRLRSRPGAGTEVELIVPSEIAFESAANDRKIRWLPRVRRERLESPAGSQRK